MRWFEGLGGRAYLFPLHLISWSYRAFCRALGPRARCQSVLLAVLGYWLKRHIAYYPMEHMRAFGNDEHVYE